MIGYRQCDHKYAELIKPQACDTTAIQRIKHNDGVYGELVRAVQTFTRRQYDDDALVLSCMAARFAWQNHTGRYADGMLEGEINKLGRRLHCASPSCTVLRAGQPPLGKQHMLHVMTMALAQGGHTRSLYTWICTDTTRTHSLLLSAQRGVDLPRWLVEAVVFSGGSVVECPRDESMTMKSSIIRQQLQSGYDAIVLHQHPDDAVVVAALSCEDLPPVAMRNHSDIMFSLGTSVSDVVIEYREAGRQMTIERRGCDRSAYLPTPMLKQGCAGDRSALRESLGIPSDAVVVLTVGSAYKYKPGTDANFFRAMNDVLQRNPDVWVIYAGDQWDQYLDQMVCETGRIILLNDFATPMGDLSSPHLVADIYVEGYPIGSQIALLEAAAIGLPVVLAPRVGPSIMTTDDEALYGIVDNPVDEAQFVNTILELAVDPGLRMEVGAKLSNATLMLHVTGLKAHYEELFKRLAGIRHTVHDISEQVPMFLSEDVSLSAFQASDIDDSRDRVLRLARQNRSFVSPRVAFRLFRISYRTNDRHVLLNSAAEWFLFLFDRSVLATLRRARMALGSKHVVAS